MIDITRQVNILAEAVHGRRQAVPRLMVAIAGPPGSGKSTLASGLRRRLTDQKVPSEVVPMDGFHLDNAVLEARGLLPRKGAPETFDSEGFVQAIRRLRGGGEVVLPTFDRTRDLSVAGALVVAPDIQVVIVEGNYLLLDELPWRNLERLWDIGVRLDVPLADLRGRLIQRWLSHGFSRPVAVRRAEANDIPNAERILSRALPAEIVIDQGDSR
ncbi:MAG: Panthothenate kinase [Rhodobacteraceae bacterium HLUCCA08]|nr:MAG: Panthothenate kinase [Rhodobacteraceae bacterium HLUCCA08]